LWSCPPTSAALAVLALACSEQGLVSTSAGTGDSGTGGLGPATDTGASLGDSAAWVDTGDAKAPCRAGPLGEANGLPLQAPDAFIETDDHPEAFGAHLGAIRFAGPQAVWATSGALEGRGENLPPEYQGAYLLTVQDWEKGGMPTDHLPLVTAGVDDIAMLHGTGLTASWESPGQAAWLGEYDPGGNGGDDYNGNGWIDHWLFVTPPEGPTTLDAADAVVRTGQRDSVHFGDLDGDGLDDAWIPSMASPAFLAPFAGTVSEGDADAFLPANIDGEQTRFAPAATAFADLDGDGTPDLAWLAFSEESDDPIDSVSVKRGPVVGGPAWTSADGRVTEERGVWRFDASAGVLGEQVALLHAVGDLTGDGLDDITASFRTDSEGDPRFGVLVVLDRFPEGTEAVSAFSTRLRGVDPAGASPLDQAGLSAGGRADVNGDGWDDLVAYQDSTDLSVGEVHRVYAMLGPLDDTISLPDAATVIDLPSTGGNTTKAIAAGDLDLDGNDDIVVYQQNATNTPSTLWLFPGCENW
jgi:hypothetical protein